MKFFKAIHFTCFFLFVFRTTTMAQKKPLDHSVYDSWQSISESQISKDGNYIAYIVNPQQGDGNLYIQRPNGDTIIKLERGYEGAFLPNNEIYVCKIKPTYVQTRQAKIDKKKDDELPKDSLAIIRLTTGEIRKIPNIKSFKVSEKYASVVAWLTDSHIKSNAKLDSVDRLRSLEKEADSLAKAADSIRMRIIQAKANGLKTLNQKEKIFEKKTIKPEGKHLHIINFFTGDSLVLSHVMDYSIAKEGSSVAAIIGASEKDSLQKVQYIRDGKIITVFEKAKVIKNITLDDNGDQLAFLADIDSSKNALRNFYSLYLYRNEDKGLATMVANRNSNGLLLQGQISEHSKLYFSKSGNRLFFGTSIVLPLADTSLPDFERVKVDIWNYKEDDLHSVQLYNLDRDLKKSFPALYDIKTKSLHQLISNTNERFYKTESGDDDYFYIGSDSGRRVARQWLGYTPQDIYSWDITNETKHLVVGDWKGSVYPSYSGNNLLLYNSKKRNYSLYSAKTQSLKLVSGIKDSIFDIDNDVPDDPDNYGVTGWTKDEKSVYIYGKYSIWKVDIANGNASLVVSGGKEKVSYQYVSLNKDIPYLSIDTLLAFNKYYEKTKNNQYVLFSLNQPNTQKILNPLSNHKIAALDKALDSNVWLFTKQNFNSSPNIYSISDDRTIQLSDINKQQSNYNWGTAELYKWKSYTGKETEGILYKPENFDSTKKYPLIAYFYERNDETLYNYLAPAPTPSRLNIPFFVSRGYIVFVPDIWYKTGHPGQAAYDYIVSGVRSLVKKGFVDSTKMGIQGQSWGGYQTAYLITKVPGMFAAAWAGAPVVNMFSAYGGIRWESGMNRQFQYEKTQSRIGATIWDKPELYVENSPLFNLPKVKTPVVIMANDADGAVPWYQGIEMFTDLRRLGKPVWLLNYNGEAHNLMQRKNRKDIQIREQQFFDWLLKGDKPPIWIRAGVPAIMKDKTMGLQY